MIVINTPQAAAAVALGCIGHTAHNQSVHFRGALERRNMSPFKLQTLCFSVQLPAAAALNLLRHWDGQNVLWVGESPAVDKDITFDGFHLRGQDKFHRESSDMEQVLEDFSKAAEDIYELAIKKGINVVEAQMFKTMDAPITLTVSGSILDFWNLRKCSGPISHGAHSMTRKTANDFWSLIAAANKTLTAVFEEVQP
jgi:hypothetical protein